MKRRISIGLLIFGMVGACADCPECPSICKDSGQDTAQDGDSESGTEPEGDDSDTGMRAAPLGQKPKPVTEFILHGRAGFDKVNIWAKPDMDSTRLGYMRKGQRTMVGDPEFSSESCPKGWFQLPEGGFVCQGRGMLVGTKPRFIPRPPPPPQVDSLDPYRHGFIRRDWTPAYKRVPTAEEMWQLPEREVSDTDSAYPSDSDSEKVPTEIIPHSTSPDDEVDGIDYYKYAKRKFKAIRQLMSKGFWVSVSHRMRDDATREYYYETIKGDFVPGNNVHLVKPPTFQGYRVQGDTPLPAAIVRSRHAAFYQLRNGQFRGVGPVERLSVYRVLGESEGKGTKYYQIEGDRWLKSNQVAYFPLREELPEGVEEGQKWILVDLTRQTLEAYEGLMPVYVTLVSTGLPDSDETVTPTGRFSIQFKHITDDMTGSVGDGEEVYQVADVPWVQYIHRNIALHASFWHSKYGHPKSHGCINLSPADARFLFNWTAPQMPEKWHGVASSEDTPGTLVIIEGTTPK